ncbi:unnamed protein product [Oikopleura dioica]|uniref:Uncharacterized protein n=1 Tax=Oikopleura dioica TaxID=34765 RepID=E4XID3_OIKDI|nr:unnamed protein product [Oikopleura dioica]
MKLTLENLLKLACGALQDIRITLAKLCFGRDSSFPQLVHSRASSSICPSFQSLLSTCSCDTYPAFHYWKRMARNAGDISPTTRNTAAQFRFLPHSFQFTNEL